MSSSRCSTSAKHGAIGAALALIAAAGCASSSRNYGRHGVVVGHSGSQVLDVVSQAGHATQVIAATRGRTAVPAEGSPQLGSQARSAQQALQAGDLETALREIRLEIARTPPPANAIQVEARGLAIAVLRDYQRFHGVSEALDREVERYHQEALELTAGDEAQQTAVNYVYATYLSGTGRNGKAIPYLRAELDFWKRAGSSYHVIKSLDALASTYDVMGDLTLRDHYRSEALSRARVYFVFPSRPSERQQWQGNEQFLYHAAAELASDGKAAELRQLWSETRAITDRFSADPQRSYLTMAEFFGAAGDSASANEVFAAAEQQPSGTDRQPSADLICTKAIVDFWSGRTRDATAGFDTCFQRRQSLGRSLSPGTAHLSAMAFEHAGDFDRAIDLYGESTRMLEQTRESFSVAERAAFFRGTARKTYWGLIRTAIRRVSRSGSETDFLAALSASELVRARQLGDRIDAAPIAISESTLVELREALAPDEVVLDFLLTDTAIIVFGFARGEFEAKIIDYEARALAAEIKAVAALFTSPQSAPAEIGASMAKISRQLLAPVASLLRGKRRIVALPDGVLNLVPFDLLDDPTHPGSPLIDNYIVLTAPSLRFVARARRQRAPDAQREFVAVADPAYGSGLEIAGMRLSELPSGKRGLGFKDYFEALPETRTEVQRIAALMGSGRTRLAMGRDATESFLKHADLRGYRFVHLATHGILGGEVPGIAEPSLVMAGEKGQDGFFTASEAAELKLDAELTVLSACKTGVGEYVTGEGVMAMSRSFLLTGSQAVAVSLWDVDSAATEELMVAFYRQLLAGADLASALRTAKLEIVTGQPTVARDELTVGRAANRRHPYYWSGFVLVGG